MNCACPLFKQELIDLFIIFYWLQTRTHFFERIIPKWFNTPFKCQSSCRLPVTCIIFALATEPTTPNMSQQGATWWPNERNMFRPNDHSMSTQHCWAQHVARRLATMLRRVATCWVLLVQVPQVSCCMAGAEDGQIWSNNTQHVATRRNMVAKRAHQCCVDLGLGLLRSFGRGFKNPLGQFACSGWWNYFLYAPEVKHR